jgi:hypothetical protein
MAAAAALSDLDYRDRPGLRVSSVARIVTVMIRASESAQAGSLSGWYRWHPQGDQQRRAVADWPQRPLTGVSESGGRWPRLARPVG